MFSLESNHDDWKSFEGNRLGWVAQGGELCAEQHPQNTAPRYEAAAVASEVEASRPQFFVWR
jgi:hypothetical protein